MRDPWWRRPTRPPFFHGCVWQALSGRLAVRWQASWWAAFEPNAEALWSRIRLDVNSFLDTLFRRGAFQAITPAQAYFVRCDSSTMTQADIDAGILTIVIGFAPLKPAEFVVLTLRQVVGRNC